MSVRSRAAVLDAPAVQVAKVFGPGVPPAIRAAEAEAQMTPTSPFGPGTPIGPYDGYSRQPRSQNFVTGVNISTRPRTHERVSFETLVGLINAYDIAQIAIWHRIDSIRSLDWRLIPAAHFQGDATDAIRIGTKALKKPDRINSFSSWLAKWLFDVLAYDAGALYRLRNRAGRCIGLLPVDGTTIAPMLDYWGNPPGAMAAPGEELPEAFVQYVNGLPWNWLTLADLVYQPFRPRTNSPYGHAPLESIILNANTDIRFQLFFLQRFTEGNIPEAFAAAPETWSPDQIEQFQEYWDGFMYGDQSRKHQIRWMPGGSKFAWSNEKDFSDTFSLFLMRKTLAAYHTVPADVGFTENVNKSSGESQADVQHRVGELPLDAYVEAILTDFLQDDLGLPVEFEFDKGEEQDDRLAVAQAHEIYIRNAVIGASEVREEVFGLPEPDGQVVPRGFFTERSGLIPLNSVLAVAGPIDPATAAPEPGSPLPHMVFGGVEGVLPNPPIKVPSLAEQEYGPSAMPPAPPPQPKMTDADATPELTAGAVAKEGEGAGGNVTAGITAATGLYSYDLDGRGGDEDEDDGPVGQAVIAKEMQAFRRYSRARRRSGEWRDFEFRAVAKVAGHNLNDSGRLAVRKDAGQVAVAGLAVLAADTGRVLMIQRALDDSDPAAGTWEVPGGHLEGAETPLHGAWREWSEECGVAPPPGTQTGSWASPDGIYQGIVWTVDSEALVPVRSDTQISNPDDPDGDSIEAIAWWDPETLPGNPAVRPELLANIDDVMAALGYGVTDDAEAEEVAKAAGGSGPKGPAWHGWTLDRKTAAHWAPRVRDSVKAAVPKAKARDMGRDYLADHPEQDGSAPGKRDRNKAAAAWVLAWLASHGITLVPSSTAEAIAVDGYAIGAVSAQHQVTGQPPGKTAPGGRDSAFDRVGEAGLAAELALLLRGGNGAEAAAEIVAEAIAGGYANALAIILAGTDADWADSQDTLDELGDLLSDALADEDTAVTLVGTQINIYTGLSAHDYYMQNSVTLVNWVTDPSKSGVCPVCVANEAASPQTNGQPWPSGDVSPPAHPNCRCQLLPAWL
jgi:ADP-ribose pyrophosphatase YjhB (NUDIX family)